MSEGNRIAVALCAGLLMGAVFGVGLLARLIGRMSARIIFRQLETQLCAMSVDELEVARDYLRGVQAGQTRRSAAQAHGDRHEEGAARRMTPAKPRFDLEAYVERVFTAAAFITRALTAAAVDPETATTATVAFAAKTAVALGYSRELFIELAGSTWDFIARLEKMPPPEGN